MKKFIILLLISFMFSITGCSSKTTNNVNNQKESKTAEKVTFTVESKHNHVTYKLPEGNDMGFFKDLGHSCNVSYYTNQSSVAALYPYDDKVEKVDKVTINGFNYDTYKYVDKLGTTYVYRTKVNNDYHLITYYCANTDYDDSQVEKFMNTVEYTYDSINSKQ